MVMQRGLHVILGVLAGYVFYSAFSDFGLAAVAANLFTPLPAAFLGMRYDARTAVLVTGLTALVTLLLSGLSPMALYLVQFGVPGALLPMLLKRGVAWDKAVAAVLGVMLAASLCGLLALSFGAGQSPHAVASGFIDREVSQTVTYMRDMFVQADLPVDQMAEVSRTVEQMADIMRRIYPGVVVTVAGLLVLGLVLLLSVAARGRYVIPGRAFPQWKSPEFLVWFLISAGFVVAFADGMSASIALNLLVVLLPIYFLHGMAVIDCYFRRKAFSPLFRGVGYLLMTLINPLPMLVTGIGVFDLWADFRKPRIKES